MLQSERSEMEPQHARVHLLHDLDRAAGCSRGLQRTIEFYREYVVEILSCDASYHHIAAEKLDALAFAMPQDIAAIRERITDARDMLAASQS